MLNSLPTTSMPKVRFRSLELVLPSDHAEAVRVARDIDLVAKKLNSLSPTDRTAVYDDLVAPYHMERFERALQKLMRTTPVLSFDNLVSKVYLRDYLIKQAVPALFNQQDDGALVIKEIHFSSEE